MPHKRLDKDCEEDEKLARRDEESSFTNVCLPVSAAIVQLFIRK